MELKIKNYSIALSFNEFDTALQIFENEITNIDFTNKNGNTIAHIAASFNHVDGIKKLVEMGANFNIKNKHGNTCLQLVPKDLASFEIVKILLDAGANPNTLTHRKTTVLLDCCIVETDVSEFIFWLVLAGTRLKNEADSKVIDTKLKDMLLPLKNRGFDLDQKNKYGETLLNIAVRYDLMQTIAQLLLFGVTSV